jgi:DNA invertase Pin-like site-specific DNA recombinase
MRAVIYARVSTPEKQEKQDPEMQTREMTEFCERRGWSKPKPVVMIDRISSGKVRPELEKLKALCRKRKFDVVLVYRFDRFARTQLELLEALQEFQALGVDFVSLHENIDTTTPAGKCMFGMIAAFSEFERAIIRERVISGLAKAKANGVRLGRPRRMPDADAIKALRRAGRTWRHIAEQYGISMATAKRAVLVGKPISGAVQ